MAYVVALIAALAIVTGAYFKGHSAGSESRNGEIVALRASISAAQILAQEAEDKAAAASARTVIEYRERVKTIREVVPGETQIIETIRDTPDLCAAPPLFRLLHNSAATGSELPNAATGIDAAPVPLEDIAATVADNYRIARENAARLESLQSLIRESLQ